MARSEFALRSRIDELARGLKGVSPKLGYSEVNDGHRTTRFKVHTLVLGDREVPVGAGGVTEALERVLREMENLARHYKPSLLLPPERKLPLWLKPDARAFASRATGAEAGVYKFGDEVTFPGTQWPTREQIVYVSEETIEMFRYFPVEKTKYRNGAHYDAAMDWNRSMQFYVERRRLAPSVARDTLAGLNREILRTLIFALFAPGPGDAISTGGDIFLTLVRAIRL